MLLRLSVLFCLFSTFAWGGGETSVGVPPGYLPEASFSISPEVELATRHLTNSGYLAMNLPSSVILSGDNCEEFFCGSAHLVTQAFRRSGEAKFEVVSALVTRNRVSTTVKLLAPGELREALERFQK